MFNNLLVPLDGSSLAESALEPATLIARYQKGKIFLATVPVYYPVTTAGSIGYGLAVPEQTFDLRREEAEIYLEHVKARLEPDLTVHAVTSEGDVAGSIIDLAVEEGIDLIVMTTHGYSGFTRWMLGSITERVLRVAPCPVLVIRCSDPLRRMVITLDGSSLAECALEPGLEIARIFDGQVTLLGVDSRESFSWIDQRLRQMVTRGPKIPVTEPEQTMEMASYLEDVASRFKSPDLEVNKAHLKGAPAEGILSYLEDHPVDLLVMATHGHTGLRRWVYGSVTQKCLHNTACAMLIVRPPAEELH